MPHGGLCKPPARPVVMTCLLRSKFSLSVMAFCERPRANTVRPYRVSGQCFVISPLRTSRFTCKAFLSKLLYSTFFTLIPLHALIFLLLYDKIKLYICIKNFVGEFFIMINIRKLEKEIWEAAGSPLRRLKSNVAGVMCARVGSCISALRI